MISTTQSGSKFPGLTLKAWGQFAAAGGLIKGFNVTSVVRSSAGIYGVTFTSAMAGTTYVINIMGTVANPVSMAITARAVGTMTINSYAWPYGAVTDQDGYFEVWE